jgi:hypothetical protein
LALCASITTPAFSAAWQKVDKNDPTLWFDFDTPYCGGESDDYIYFDFFNGASGSDDWMTQESFRVAVDCIDGSIFEWDQSTSDWYVSTNYDREGPVGDLALDGCMYMCF